MSAATTPVRTTRRRATIRRPAQPTHVDVLNRLVEAVGGQTELARRMTGLSIALFGEVAGQRYSPNTLCNWQRRGVPTEQTRILMELARQLGVAWPDHLPVWMPPGALA